MDNQAKLLEKHQERWVAVKPDYSAVVAASKSLKKLKEKLEKLSEDNLLITYVQPFTTRYAP